MEKDKDRVDDHGLERDVVEEAVRYSYGGEDDRLVAAIHRLVEHRRHETSVKQENPSAVQPSELKPWFRGRTHRADFAYVHSDVHEALAVALNRALHFARIRSDLNEKLHGRPTSESWVPAARAALALVTQEEK